MQLYVTLPCKPVVKQYIVNRYGNPVKFPQNDWLRSMLVKYLQRPDRHYENKTTLQYYTAQVDLPIMFREYTNFGNVLSRTSIMHINQTVQDIIEEALYNYLNLYHAQAGILLKTAIVMFRNQYGFPEESYSTEAIHKFWQRECARRKKVNKNTPENVLLIKSEHIKVAIFAKT